MKVINGLDMELCVNNSWSGSKVTGISESLSAGCNTRCQNLGEDPDVIIVWMGINDFDWEVSLGEYDGTTAVGTDTTKFRDAYGIMLNKILTTYPKAEVFVCTLLQDEINQISTGFPEINDAGIPLKEFNDAIVELAASFGVKVLDNNTCGIRYHNLASYTKDYLHPTHLGHDLLANNMIRQMLAGGTLYAPHLVSSSLNERIEDIENELEPLTDIIKSQSVVYCNGYNANNVSNAAMNTSPFSISRTMDQDIKITSIKLIVVTAGTLSLGTVDKTYLVANADFDRSNVTIHEVLNITETGEQTITLSTPIDLPTTKALTIGNTTDTIVFKYGQNGTHKGFYYINSGKLIASGSSLGFDIYGETATKGIAELIDARGSYNSLDERLDAMGSGSGGSGLQNLVDGSASGSVRGTGTAAESSSYTMGIDAVAEGNSTKASGDRSHAEGAYTVASGYLAHAEGRYTTASGQGSHTEGNYTIANHGYQHVFGEYNVADTSSAAVTSRGNYVEIVGNGTSSARSNARTLDWNGNEVLAGKLTVGSDPVNDMDVATKQYVDRLDDSLSHDELITEDTNSITFTTDSAQIAKNTKVTFEPIQDLHEYDHPWPAGSGKNLLPLTIENAKSSPGNIAGTWVDNSFIMQGITFTFLTDSGGNVIAIKANGTANGQDATVKFFGSSLSNDQNISYPNDTKLTFDVQGSSSTYRGIMWGDNGSYIDSGELSINANSIIYGIGFRIIDGVTVDNLMIYPMIRLATETDDTFEPYSNICPISGFDEVNIIGRGKNLFDCTVDNGEYTNAGVTYKNVYDDHGNAIGISASGTSTGYSQINFNITLLAGRYKTNVSDTSSGNVGVSIRKGSAWFANVNSEFTLTEETALRIRYYVDTSGKVANNTIYCMLYKYDGTDQDFEPYQSHEIAQSLPETVYGGTLDLESGELVVEYGIFDMGEATWSSAGNGLYYRTSSPSDSQELVNRGCEAVCSCYKNACGKTIDEFNASDSEFFLNNALYSASAKYILVRDTKVENATAFKTKMSGQTIAYELSIPITYHLTPHQLAIFAETNNISTNATKIQVTYREGEIAVMEDVAGMAETLESQTESKIQSVVNSTDSKIQSVLGNFADIEQVTATSNHSVGDYIVVNNKLRKVTAAIASGESIDDNNSSVTTVEAEIASMKNLLGNTSISGTGQETVTDAISTLNSCIGQVSIESNVLDYALSLPNGAHKIVKYMGTDYSWVPDNDSNYRYGMFIIDRGASVILVDAYSWNGALHHYNYYGNNVWQGWQ